METLVRTPQEIFGLSQQLNVPLCHPGADSGAGRLVYEAAKR